jgi:hypothetical protein
MSKEAIKYYEENRIVGDYLDKVSVVSMMNGFHRQEQDKQLILSGVGNSTSLKEMLVDFGNVVRNSKGQEVELLADAYIVYDRIKDEKEQ